MLRIIFLLAHPGEGKASPSSSCKQEGRRAVEPSVQYAAGQKKGASLQGCKRDSWAPRQAAQMNLAIPLLYYYVKVQQQIFFVYSFAAFIFQKDFRSE